MYTRIARLALEEKSVPYELDEIEVFGRDGVPAEHFKRHPFGRIPVLVHADLSLYETSAICRYVDEAFPGASLQPATAARRARLTQIVSLLDSYAYRPMVWGVFVQRVRRPLQGFEPDEKLIASSLTQADTVLQALVGIKGASPYLAGSELSLADLHAFPMLKYFHLAPEGRAAVTRHASLAEWLARMEQRRSVVSTQALYERSAQKAA